MVFNFSKKPHPPANDDFLGSLDLVHAQLGPKFFCSRAIVCFLALLSFLPAAFTRLIVFGRIHQKDQRFLRGDVAIRD